MTFREVLITIAVTILLFFWCLTNYEREQEIASLRRAFEDLRMTQRPMVVQTGRFPLTTIDPDEILSIVRDELGK